MKKNSTRATDSHGNENSSTATNGIPAKKKEYWVNLRKNGFFRFQIGLILALLMAYFGLEASFKVLQPTTTISEPIPPDLVLIEPDIPKWRAEQPQQEVVVLPKAVTNPDKIRIEKNDSGKKETPSFIAPIPPDDGNLDPNNIPYEEPDKDEVIPIAAVQEAPIFPGCEKVKTSERFNCFNKKMNRHVRRNFRFPESAITLRQQGKVYAIFKIGLNGEIEDVEVRGPAKMLEKEASRIIHKLPQMTPGKNNGKPVRVSYSIPINFILE